jgi:hypothetical protein
MGLSHVCRTEFVEQLVQKLASPGGPRSRGLAQL